MNNANSNLYGNAEIAMGITILFRVPCCLFNLKKKPTIQQTIFIEKLLKLCYFSADTLERLIILARA